MFGTSGLERGAMDLARSEHVPVVLAAMAVGVACWVLARRRRARAWRASGGTGTVPNNGATCWLLAILAAGVALVGPRWGYAPGGGAPRGHEVVLLVDVSRSMAAEDAVPNRLGAAVAGASALVEALGRSPGERVAVVAFAGRGVLRCPLTSNLGAVRETLARLRPGAVRPGGTDLGAALDAAREAFPEAVPGVEGPEMGRSVVVFSDGEDLEGRGSRAIEGLRASGVVVHAVAIGDSSKPGATVPVRGESGDITPLMYQGEVVHTRREDAALRELAAATGGMFIPLGVSRPEDVAGLYRTSIEPSERVRLEALARGAPLERSDVFTLLALGAGLAGVWPFRRRNRGSSGLVVLAMLAIGADQPPAAHDPGLSAFQAGRLDGALASYKRDIAATPSAPVPRFNAAVVLQRLGRHAEADTLYAQALARAGDQPTLAARIEFARGNNAYYLGDREAALAHYDACLERSSGDDPDIAAIQRDARVNRAFVSSQSAPKPKPEEPSTETTPAPGEDRKKGNEQESVQQPRLAPPGTRGGEPLRSELEGLDVSETPEEQLEVAVERIRRRSRPDSAPKPSAVDATRRDW